MPLVDLSRHKAARDRHIKATKEALGGVYADQQSDVAARLDAGASVLLAARWDQVLAEAAAATNFDTAAEFARLVAVQFGNRGFDPEILRGWVEVHAEGSAAAINGQTRERLVDADADRVAEVMGNLQDGGVSRHALSMVTGVSMFGSHDAAEKSGAGLKRWTVTSNNPRSSHLSVSGEEVPLSENFSNGLRWPGDGQASAEQVANCRCALTIL